MTEERARWSGLLILGSDGGPFFLLEHGVAVGCVEQTALGLGFAEGLEPSAKLEELGAVPVVERQGEEGAGLRYKAGDFHGIFSQVGELAVDLRRGRGVLLILL